MGITWVRVAGVGGVQSELSTGHRTSAAWLDSERGPGHDSPHYFRRDSLCPVSSATTTHSWATGPSHPLGPTTTGVLDQRVGSSLRPPSTRATLPWLMCLNMGHVGITRSILPAGQPRISSPVLPRPTISLPHKPSPLGSAGPCPFALPHSASRWQPSPSSPGIQKHLCWMSPKATVSRTVLLGLFSHRTSVRPRLTSALRPASTEQQCSPS